MTKRALPFLLVPCLCLAAEKPKPKAPEPGRTTVKVPASALRALKARSIGPAIMGGRVTTIAADPGNPQAFYVGLATGGLMKTGNNGVTFDAIFEKESTASIGAVAVSPSDPRVLWVGTGEATDRNSAGWGDGVYRSTDGGENWTHAGLASSRTIARVAVHPTDAKVAWVAATGDLWTPGGERGLYKTTDGGANWSAVLKAKGPRADVVGCGDVVLDPSNPDDLYAALYARRRFPWAFQWGSGATGGEDLGGLFRSSDGGATWKKLGGGLPARTGRIGLDVSRSSPKVVYAVVQSEEGGDVGLREQESKRGGLFRSDDGGETFTRVSKLNPRPFYFSEVRVDPLNEDRVYLLGFSLLVSDDGGRSFREDLSEKVHPDLHALVVTGTPARPAPPKDGMPAKRTTSPQLLLGTDGGVYQSFDAGKNWDGLDKMASGEFYRISLDDSTPYRVCGGLQDNYSWVGPNESRSKDGLVNGDWISLGGGDGFSCAFSADRDVIYGESQGGDVFRLNLANGERKSLRPEPAEGSAAFRFHWNTPLFASRHDKDTLYLGGNRLFKLTAGGREWTPISPDLTAQDPEKTSTVGSGAERYGVIYTVAESPLKAGLLWAGTDDGKLWITQDGGGRWTDLTANLPAAAKGQWISRVEAGSHDAAVAYVAVDAHRGGRFEPLAYRTADAGRTWQSVSGDLPKDVPVKVVREDARNADLLYAGLETGLYVSLDRGASWTKLGELPTVAVDDLQVHPRDRDLVIATHGRSLYVIDDVSALQALTAEVLASELRLFPPAPAHGSYPRTGTFEWAGKGVFRGENPPEGALITFWVKEYTGDPVTLTITNAADQPVAKLKPTAVPGLNRVSWDLKLTKDYINEYASRGTERFVPAGEYTVTLSRGKTKLKEKLKVTIAEGIETR